jgi:hypothetical protein
LALASAGRRAELPSAALGRRAELPSAALGRRAELSSAALGRRAELPSAALGRRAELSSAALGRRAELPSASLGRRAELPSAALGRRAELSSAALGRRAELSSAALGRRAELSSAALGRAEKALIDASTSGCGSTSLASSIGEAASSMNSTIIMICCNCKTANVVRGRKYIVIWYYAHRLVRRRRRSRSHVVLDRRRAQLSHPEAVLSLWPTTTQGGTSEPTSEAAVVLIACLALIAAGRSERGRSGCARVVSTVLSAHGGASRLVEINKRMPEM